MNKGVSRVCQTVNRYLTAQLERNQSHEMRLLQREPLLLVLPPIQCIGGSDDRSNVQ
jgi:hypothetical protein